MAKDKICKPFLAISTDKFTVDTIEDLKSIRYLAIGDVVEVNGELVAGDGKHHKRKISNADDGSGVQLNNGLWANEVENSAGNKKLDKGSYTGNAEALHADDNAIWGGEYGGYIQDTSVTKVVGKRYIDQFDGKAYECLVPSHENTITNYQACNVKDNLSKLNNLFEKVVISADEYYVINKVTGWKQYFAYVTVPGGNTYTAFNLPFRFSSNKYAVQAFHAGSAIVYFNAGPNNATQFKLMSSSNYSSTAFVICEGI